MSTLLEAVDIIAVAKPAEELGKDSGSIVKGSMIAPFFAVSEAGVTALGSHAEDNLGPVAGDELFWVAAEGQKVFCGTGADIIVVAGAEQVELNKGLGLGIRPGYVTSGGVSVTSITQESGQLAVNGGNSVDMVLLQESAGDNCHIDGQGGNDLLVVNGGRDHFIVGGTGNDRFVLKELEEQGNYYIDQSNAGAKDRDSLQLSSYESRAFRVDNTEPDTLKLKNVNNGAVVTINNWLDHPLQYISFADGRLKAENIGLTKDGDSYSFKLQGAYSFNASGKVEAYDSSLHLVAQDGRLMVSGNNNQIYGNEIGNSIILRDGKGNSIHMEGGSAEVELRGGTDTKVYFGSEDNRLIISGGQAGEIKSEGSLQVYLRNGTYNIDENTEYMPICEGGNNKINIDRVELEKLEGGMGNDTFVLNSGLVERLKGGLGNDTYELKQLEANKTYVIDQGLLAGEERTYVERDCLKLENYDKQQLSYYLDENNDVIIKVSPLETTIKVEGWRSNPLQSIVCRDGTITRKELGEMLGVQNFVKSQQEVIYNFMQSLDATVKYGLEAFNEAVAACSEGLYGSAAALINSFKNDCMLHGGNTTLAQKNFLLDYCGINLDNADTGAITGLDAGGPVEKTKLSVVEEPEGLELEDLVYDYPDKIMAINNFANRYQEFTCATVDTALGEFTVYWDESDIYNLVSRNLVANEQILKNVISSIVEGWLPAGLDLIYNSYGLAYGEEGCVLRQLEDGTRGIQLCLDYSSPSVNSSYRSDMPYNWVAATYNWSNNAVVDGVNQLADVRESIVINMYYYPDGLKDISGSPEWGGRTSQELDRVFVHELVHGTMAANINNFNSLNGFLKEGLAELVHGIDDHRRSAILNVANTSLTFYDGGISYNQYQYLNKIFDLSDPYYLMSGESYGAGYTLLRYLAKQVSDYSLKRYQGEDAWEETEQLMIAENSFAAPELIGELQTEQQLNKPEVNCHWITGNC